MLLISDIYSIDTYIWAGFWDSFYSQWRKGGIYLMQSISFDRDIYYVN